MPIAGSVASAAAGRVPSVRPTRRASTVPSPLLSPTPLPSTKNPGGATTGTSARRHSRVRVSTTSSPLTVSARPASMCSVASASEAPPSGPMSSCRPSSMPATSDWPRVAMWPACHCWRWSSVPAVSARPAKMFGRCCQVRAASSAFCGDSAITRSPGKGWVIGVLLRLLTAFPCDAR